MIGFLAALALQTVAVPSDTTVILAVCSASVGKTFYVSPRVTGWVDDGVGGGSITLIKDAAGKADLITRDAMGRSQLASSTGVVLAPLVDIAAGEYLFVVIDNERNEVVTYQVSTNASGQQTLLWTDNKNRKTSANISKVSAFTAPCEGLIR